MAMAMLANIIFGVSIAAALFGGLVRPDIWVWELLSLALAGVTCVAVASLTALDS